LDDYLTHYWPITNGTMNDAIGAGDMAQGGLTNFTADRFGCESSALALNGGWTAICIFDLDRLLPENYLYFIFP
jgi:hypothetical protein